MPIAFFDLDKTLLADNSARLWLKELWRARHIDLLQMIDASYWLAKYHLGFNDMDGVINKALALMAGEKESFVLQQTAEFFHQSVRDIYRPGALAAIASHKKQNHPIALLTSSFYGLSLLVQKDLGLDHCLCTRLQVGDDGLYTGDTIGPPCFGRSKIIFAKKLCDELNIALGSCVFYTDSASDIPLLNLVGQAVAVNPDPHLRARAKLKRWQIVDWGKPAWMNQPKKFWKDTEHRFLTSIARYLRW